jgi:hypothetical protein
MAAVCLVTAGILWASGGAVPMVPVSTQEQTTDEPVWVEVTADVPNGKESEYYIGTISPEKIVAIELDKYDRTFLRISNLRVQEQDESGRRTHFDWADELDHGIILVRYDTIVSIQFMKGDPLLADGRRIPR